MSTILATKNATAAFPNYSVENVNSTSNSPGNNATDFVVDAYSPLYLRTGSAVNGWLCTDTAVARVLNIGGLETTETFTNLHTFGTTSSARQMQAVVTRQDWVMVASYDSGGVRCTYTTNGGVTWQTSTVTNVVAPAFGFTWCPGLWMSERTAGTAVVTAYKTGATSVSDTTTFNESPAKYGFISVQTICGQINPGAGGMQLDSGFGSPASSVKATSTPNGQCSAIGVRINPDTFPGILGDVTRVSFDVYWNGSFAPLKWFRADAVLYNASTNQLGTKCYTSATTSSSSPWGCSNSGVIAPNTWFTVDVDVSLANTTYVEVSFQSHIAGGGAPLPMYIDNVRITTSSVSAAAYLTTNFGATWTEITPSSSVAFINPGFYLAGAVEAPYRDVYPYRFVYGRVQTGGSYLVPRLYRSINNAVQDISPTANGKTYGVPLSTPHRRAVFISVKDPNHCMLCGQSVNASSGISTWRVFRTTNLWSPSPVWTPVDQESTTQKWIGGYFSGDSPLLAYLLGTNGNFGFWRESTNQITDKKGDSTNTSKVVGLCGF